MRPLNIFFHKWLVLLHTQLVVSPQQQDLVLGSRHMNSIVPILTFTMITAGIYLDLRQPQFPLNLSAPHSLSHNMTTANS